MELVLANYHFRSVGGSETYLLTVAEQLQRLGHGVTIHTSDAGRMADLAAQRGIDVVDSERRLPDEADAVLVQDSVMSYSLAERLPGAHQVFRAPSELFDLQLPPALPGVVSSVVVLSDRVRNRVRAMDVGTPVHRLRQPVDTERFAPSHAPRARPRRAVLLGNYLAEERAQALAEAWESRGVSCVVVGGATAEADPRPAIHEADIVVAKGRAAIEGMACGRPVYVYDAFGTDGWVTPDTYAPLEADNFAGLATDAVVSPNRLRADLDAYRPDMGLANRDLATRHHGARAHAAQLVEILREGSAPAVPPSTPLRELARLVELQWRAQGELIALAEESERRRRRAEEATDRAEEAERQLARARELLGTRRARAGLALGNRLDRLRRRS